MDPLLISLVIGYFITNGVRDAAYAVRGKDSPRMAARRSRAESGALSVAGAVGARVAARVSGGPRKQEKTPAGKRSPARRYLSELNADVWESATTRRRDMAARRAQRRTTRQANRLERQTARRERRAATRDREPGQPVPQPAVTGLGRDNTPYPERETPRPDDDEEEDVPDAAATRGDTDVELQLASEYRCPWRDGDGSYCGRPAQDGLVYCPDHQTEADEQPDRPDQPGDRDAGRSEQGERMTQVAAAEGGLATAIEWCNSMIEQVGAAGPACEQTAAYLEAQDVSGDAVDGIREAMDQFNAVVASLSKARDDLVAQNIIKEAYLANPGAGSKEFILTE